MQGDEVQKQVAEVAKSLYQRTDELVVMLAGAIAGHSWSSPLMSAVGAEALPRIACTLSSIDMYSAWMGGCLQ